MLSEIWFSGGYFGVHASWSCHRWFGVDISGPAGSAPPDPVIIGVFFQVVCPAIYFSISFLVNSVSPHAVHSCTGLRLHREIYVIRPKEITSLRETME